MEYFLLHKAKLYLLVWVSTGMYVCNIYFLLSAALTTSVAEQEQFLKDVVRTLQRVFFKILFLPSLLLEYCHAG